MIESLRALRGIHRSGPDSDKIKLGQDVSTRRSLSTYVSPGNRVAKYRFKGTRKRSVVLLMHCRSIASAPRSGNVALYHYAGLTERQQLCRSALTITRFDSRFSRLQLIPIL